MLLCAVLAGCAAPSPADVKADAVRRGDELSAREDHAAAARAYQAAATVDPRDGVVRMKLSKALRAAEVWAAGAEEGIRAAGLLPDDLDAQLWGVSMRISESQFVDALQAIELLRGKYPDNAMLLVYAGNATARLINETWALYRLSEAMRTHDHYDWIRQTLRMTTQPPEDREAEALFRRALQLDPGNWETRLAMVNFLWATGRAAEAEPALRQLADEIPDHLLINVALGRDYLRQGRYADAAKYLAVARAGGDSTVVIELADVYLQLGQFDNVAQTLAADTSADAGLRLVTVARRQKRLDEARQRLDDVLKRDPNHAEALRTKAEFLLETGDAAAALTAARSAVGQAPSSVPAHLILAQAASKAGNAKEAFDEFVEVARLNPGNREVLRDLARLALSIGRDRAAVEFAGQAVRNDPRDRQARADLVEALTRVGEVVEAERELAPLLAAGKPSAVELVLSGRVHSGRGRTAAATEAYRQALTRDRDSFEALSGLVTLDLAAGRNKEARARADDALRAHPDSPPHQRLVATVALAQDDPAGAEAMLRAVLAANPSDAATLVLLDEALGRLHRPADAIALLEQAVAQQRTAPVEVQLALAARLDQAGRTAEARKRYETVVADYPHSPRAGLGLAVLFARDGEQLDIALNLASEARRQMPRVALASDTLGLVYLKRGLPTLGVPHLEDATRAEPNNAAFQYHLGLAYLGKGDRPRARAALSRALSLDAGFSDAAEARSTLASLGQ